jgi:peptidoglycan/LPS O-acetylase OafA/YrhL
MTYAYADTFVAGALVARLHLDGWKISEQLRLWFIVFAAITLIILARLWGTTLFPPYPAYAAVPYALLPIAGALAMSIAIGNTPRTPLLARAPLRAIGTLSYSIYLVHLIAKYEAEYIVADVETTSYRLVVIALTFILAVVLYFGIERPALILKQKINPAALRPWPAVVSVALVLTGLLFYTIGP